MQQEQFIYIDKFGNKYYHKDKEMTIRHRLDGPAVETPSGYKSWWVDGNRVTEKQCLALTQPTELTLKEIADKFNISVEQLRIKD